MLVLMLVFEYDIKRVYDSWQVSEDGLKDTKEALACSPNVLEIFYSE